MNSIHDMGGMAGMGPIAPEADEPVFHHAWEGRVHALTAATPIPRSNIDAGRHQRELIPAAEYLAMSYYEKWLRGFTERLLDQGVVSRRELETGRADPAAPKATPTVGPADIPGIMSRPGSYLRDGPAPRFAVGDRVRARNLNPAGHTRLARYVRGRKGVIEAFRGIHVFPDTNAHFRGEDPQPLYTVRFTARELWGPNANPRDSVSLDLWEPYLERA
ncbi:MAG: nitrile hydratase subunit beta [Phenylobacterium sp.]